MKITVMIRKVVTNSHDEDVAIFNSTPTGLGSEKEYENRLYSKVFDINDELNVDDERVYQRCMTLSKDFRLRGCYKLVVMKEDYPYDESLILFN